MTSSKCGPATARARRTSLMTAAYMCWGECFPQEQLGTLHVQRRGADGAEDFESCSKFRGPAIRAGKCVKCPATRTCISNQHISPFCEANLEWLEVLSDEDCPRGLYDTRRPLLRKKLMGFYTNLTFIYPRYNVE